MQRFQFEKRHQTGRSSRKFGFKEQFTFMDFIQLVVKSSLRNALRCLESMPSRLYHWGLGKIARSTVADANATRPVEFFKVCSAKYIEMPQAHSLQTVSILR